MNRHLLLAGVGGAALLMASARPAHAVFGVGDTTWCLNCTTEYSEVFREIARAAQVAKQLATAEQQAQTALNTYRSFTGVRDLGSAMSALNLLGVQNPFPVDAYALQGILNGQGGSTGMLANLQGLYTGTYASNQVFLPSSPNWVDQQRIAMARGMAGQQALALNAYRASGDRLTSYAGARARLGTASDPAEVAQIQASVAIANGEQAAQNQQLLATYVAAQAQREITQQRDQQHESQCITQLISYFNRTSDSSVCPAASTGGATAQTVAYNTGAGMSASASASIIGTGNGAALQAMMAQPWGVQAAQAAQQVGVNPATLAAMGQVESNFQNTSNGNAVGVFQMTPATFQAAAAAAGGSPDLAGRMDPGTEALAAAQEIKSQASTLQAAGIASPTGLDTRGGYNFGSSYAVPLARAGNSDLMGNVLNGYSAATLASNGISPGMTVGQWRGALLAKAPDLAQPVSLAALRSS